jgi:thiol:disulfide interchange protein
MKRFAPILLLVPAIARAGEPELTPEQYGRVMDRTIAKIETAARVLQRHSFASRLELAAAMRTLTPDHFAREALAEMHVTGAQMAAFVQNHPDIVKNFHVEERGQQAIEPLAKRGEELPRLDDLDGAIKRANRRHRPLLLVLTAKWAAASQDLLDQSLKDAGVLEMLRHYELAIVDLTNPDGLVRALQDKYRVHVLPTSLVLRSGVERLRIEGFVDADRLRAALAKASP